MRLQEGVPKRVGDRSSAEQALDAREPVEGPIERSRTPANVLEFDREPRRAAVAGPE